MASLRVGILCGGVSAEHPISLISAHRVVQCLDTTRYTPIIIGITPDGAWHRLPSTDWLCDADDPARVRLNLAAAEALAWPLRSSTTADVRAPLAATIDVDVVFPVLHGPFGEDGCVQGLLQTLDLPFVGCGVLPSALAMYKGTTKQVLQQAGLPVGATITIQRWEYHREAILERVAGFDWPLFVKPNNLGSSVGISKVATATELPAAMETAFQFDHTVIIEAGIEGRELECAVLGYQRLRASVPGEIIPQHDFYSFTAKYLDPDGAALVAPADVSAAISERVQTLSMAAFRAIHGVGMARVDFFLTPAGELFINEINPIPGFTAISMYPRLWAETGIATPELLDELIQIALQRAQDDRLLQRSYRG